MSESAVILEGEVARRFNPVDKLRATNQDSSVSDWVPSDTLDLGSLMASENNLYLANIDDDCDAYEEVEVDVSTDLEDADDETKATKKITGTGSDGNDYAVGLDENGNLTTEKIPSAIHIVVPPTKRKYKIGDAIDYSGIHVYLMDANNHRYTDEGYPTGEIPFDELLFPVTIAESESGGSSSIGTNGGWLKYSFEIDEKETIYRITYETTEGSTLFSILYVDPYRDERNRPQFNSIAILASDNPFKFSVEQPPFNTLYYDGKPVSYEGNSFYYGYYASNSIALETAIHESIFAFPGRIVDKEYYKTLSSRDENVIKYAWEMLGEEPSDTQKIPVQWIRSDGEILEDEFEIEVGSGIEPTPEPEPDPWAGYADVSWNGHHYNLNRRVVPEVHYANGYLWQEGISTEYSVEQAASMGWLILIR